jgi:hypothetical protein
VGRQLQPDVAGNGQLAITDVERRFQDRAHESAFA